MQCGDMQFVMKSLLQDRQQEDVTGSDHSLKSRSLYRQLLFLKCAIQRESFDIGERERERDYQLCLSPKTAQGTSRIVSVLGLSSHC